MALSASLSGLNAATADLDVKSNNLANVNTTGFKQSRAEFGDVFAASALGLTSATALGSGTQLERVAQQYGQGSIDLTDNALDLAINGGGFFTLTDGLDSNNVVFSRAGEFSINKDGYIVSNEGWYLQTFPVDTDGNISATSINATQPLQIPSAVGAPEATDELTVAPNLPSTTQTIVGAANAPVSIDPTDSSTYNFSTSATIYDSLGNEHVISMFYQHMDPNTVVGGSAVGDNQWRMSTYVDGGDIKGGTAGVLSPLDQDRQLSFDSSGTLTSPTTTVPLTFTDGGTPEWTSGAGSQTIALSLTGSTQNSGTFSLNTLSNDGFPVGRLTGLDISENGLVQAKYSNGNSELLGKLAMADFPNVQGLKNIGNTAWVETVDSGPAIAGEAGTSSFGGIQSGALEASNVDLTKELVGLITAQRNFQANSKAIESHNELVQTVINIR